MRTLPRTESLQLREHEAKSLRRAEGLTLQVDQGRLWVTQSGDAADYILRAGDTMVLGPNLIVIEALDPSTALLRRGA